MKRSSLKVVMYGSAASRMIEKILNDRRRLYNRVTQTIRLLPFTLAKESTWGATSHPREVETGAQIDLLFYRQDRTINLCEMKFAGDEFVIDKKYAEEFDDKVKIFQVKCNLKHLFCGFMKSPCNYIRKVHYSALCQAFYKIGAFS